MAADEDDQAASLSCGPCVSRRSHVPAADTWPPDVGDGGAEKQPLPADLIWFHHGTHCRALPPICILSPAREKVSAGKSWCLLHHHQKKQQQKNMWLKPRPRSQLEELPHYHRAFTIRVNCCTQSRARGGVVFFFSQWYSPFRI